MKLNAACLNPLEHVTPCLIVGCFEDEQDEQQLKELDSVLEGLIRRLFLRKEFTGRLNSTLMIHTMGKTTAERILLVGLGKRSELNGERMRQASGSSVQALRAAGIAEASSSLHFADGNGGNWIAPSAEGFLLGNYRFELYKSRQPDQKPSPEELTLLTEESYHEKAGFILNQTEILCRAVNSARELVDQPCNVATPAFLAARAKELSEHLGIQCSILHREEMKNLGMAALLAVAKGSRQPPCTIVLRYQGAGAEGKPVVLVGKGVTFDSGGISLKPREGMEKMKNDMAGGAAVIGTLAAAAGLKLPVNLVGIIAAAENLPGGDAFKPGDVLKAMSGRSIEIVNTDAEGRLLLCDALHYARSFDPAAIIDVATLTGACVVALGTLAAGLISSSDELAAALEGASEATGERVWQLPLWEEYGELMKSDIADCKNAGGPNGGALTAAWFLRQFVGDIPWAHLDIAGTAWEEKGSPYNPKGATGAGVRLLVEYLKSGHQPKPVNP